MSPKIHVDKHRCKGCGYCVELCPMKTLSMSEEIGPKGYHTAQSDDQGECLECGLCESICPDFALTVTPDTEDSNTTEAEKKQK